MRYEKLFEPFSSIDYTFDSMSGGERSILDHFLLSENLRDNVINYCVVHEGDNLSDHDPIRLLLDFQVHHSLLTKSFARRSFSKKLCWRDAKESSLMA